MQIMGKRRARVAVAAALWLVSGFLGGIPRASAESEPQASAVPMPDAPTAIEVPTPRPQTADSPAAGYRVQPGDVLSLTVLGESSYSGDYPVRADGTILFSDGTVPPIAVGGRTVEAATTDLRDRLGEYLRDPGVVVSLTRFKLIVIGDVRRPGQYDIAAGTRLAEAITLAGGPKDDRDLRSVYLTRESGEEVVVDLVAFRRDGDASQNPVLQPGDRVSVDREPGSDCGECRVLGAVERPGMYRLDADGETHIADIIEEAGRWLPDGNPGATKVMRSDGTEVTVDLSSLDEDPWSAGNIVVQDGDRIFVPRNGTQINVLGGVRSPGPYRVAAGTTLLEAIATAGGLTDGAVLDGCAVIRSQPESVRIPANLRRLINDGDMTQNPALQDRDVVFVPQGAPPAPRGRSALQTVADSVIRLSWLFSVF